MTQTVGEFRETEIGTLPIDWETVDLGQVYAIQQGKAISKKHRTGPNLRPFLRTSNVYWGRLELETLDEMNFKPEEEQKLRLQAGDLLICEGGDIGRTAIWNSEVTDCYYQNHVFRVRSASPDAHSLFHMYWMQAGLTLLGCYSGYGNKTTIPNLSKRRLASFPIPLPPLPEQRRIAAVLTALQDAMAAQEDVIAAAREFKRSLMHRLFTYGPGPVPAETKETLFGEVPQMWDSRPLSECAVVQAGTTKGRRFKPEDDVVSVPYLRVANVQDGYLDLSEIKEIDVKRQDIDRYRLEVGDVLMTEGGDFDKLGRGFIWQGEIENCIHQNHVFAVRTHRDLLQPDYLAYLAQSPYGKNYFLSVAHRTTNLASINSTKLKALPVLLPDLSEQAAIVEMMASADAKIAAEEDRKTALDALFKSMLHQLMTGQVRLLGDEGLLSP